MTATRRSYRMQARAESTLATRERILDATIELFFAQPTDQISLEDVARRAGVTKQTVLRRFESRAGLLAAAAERSFDRVRTERDAVPGDLAAAVGALVSHYERTADGVLRMLAEEERNPGLRDIADRGRAYHEEWCERVFAPALAGLRGAARKRRLAQVIAVTDVYIWKLLARDRGLSRPQTEAALRELLEPLMGGSR